MNIGEILYVLGILTVVSVFGINKQDPIHSIVKVPVCKDGVSTEEWIDMTKRIEDAGGYCGRCGAPTKCPKFKQFDEYK